MILLFSCLSISMIAQKEDHEKMNVNSDVDLVKVFEQVILEGYGTPIVYMQLANAYYFKDDYTNAKKWFETLFAINKPSDATLKYRYRQTLKALDIEIENNQYLGTATN